MNGNTPIRIIVKGKAVPNQYIAIRRGSAAIPLRTAKTKAYIKRVKDEAAIVMRGKDALLGPIDQRITFYTAVGSMSKKKTQEALAGGILPATRYSCDIDNIVKTVGDGLDGVVYKDDAQVVTLTAMKRYAMTDYVEIEVREIGWHE